MKKRTIKILTLVLLLSLTIYLYSQSQNKNEDESKSNKVEEITKSEDEKILFDKTPAKEDANYFEGIENIQGQPMYYSYPLEIKKKDPPELIVYSHGQLQRIVENLDDEYMQKMKKYGEFFSKKGFAFSASNQHGDNWGQQEALNDIQNSIEWFEEENLPIKDKVYMIGFSMGGRAAINYTILNPQKVKTVSLLAPTPRESLSQEDVEKIKDIPIKIWHGTSDINIPFTTSELYVQNFQKHNKQVKLIPIENAQHYDVETSLMDDIFEFIER